MASTTMASATTASKTMATTIKSSPVPLLCLCIVVFILLITTNTMHLAAELAFGIFTLWVGIFFTVVDSCFPKFWPAVGEWMLSRVRRSNSSETADIELQLVTRVNSKATSSSGSSFDDLILPIVTAQVGTKAAE